MVGWQVVPVSSWLKSNELKWSEAEMNVRASKGQELTNTLWQDDYSADVERMKACKTSIERKKVFKALGKKMSVHQNNIGVKSEPVFRKLGYFRWVHSM